MMYAQAVRSHSNVPCVIVLPPKFQRTLRNKAYLQLLKPWLEQIGGFGSRRSGSGRYIIR